MTHPPPNSISPCHSASSASCAPRPGRNPYEQSRKSCSYTGSSTISTARCRTLSSSVGMPIGRVLLVPGFSRCTRRTAGARYRPDLNLSSNPARFASNSASYCAAVTPSTPAAASLRTRRHASRIHTASMWCASVVSVSFGSLWASSAILRCRVEMTSRPNVPAICHPASSIIRSAASHPPGPLGRVPRPHRCRVGGGAPQGWPPSAAQTARTVFP